MEAEARNSGKRCVAEMMQKRTEEKSRGQETTGEKRSREMRRLQEMRGQETTGEERRGKQRNKSDEVNTGEQRREEKVRIHPHIVLP